MLVSETAQGWNYAALLILIFRSKSITDSLDILQYSFHSIKRKEPKFLIQNPLYSSQVHSSQNNIHVSSLYQSIFFHSCFVFLLLEHCEIRSNTLPVTSFHTLKLNLGAMWMFRMSINRIHTVYMLHFQSIFRATRSMVLCGQTLVGWGRD